MLTLIAIFMFIVMVIALIILNKLFVIIYGLEEAIKRLNEIVKNTRQHSDSVNK